MAIKMRTIGKTPILLVASLLMPFVITAASLPTEPLGENHRQGQNSR